LKRESGFLKERIRNRRRAKRRNRDGRVD